MGIGWERFGYERFFRDFVFVSIGVFVTMSGLWFLFFFWGLVVSCWGLLETVGTFVRIDKDEFSKGESGWAVFEGFSCRVNDFVDVLERLFSGIDENRMRSLFV